MIIKIALGIILGLASYNGMRRWIAREGAGSVGLWMFGAILTIAIVGISGWLLAANSHQVGSQAELATDAAQRAAINPPASCGVTGAPACPGSAPASLPTVEKGSINRPVEACESHGGECITLSDGAQVVIDPN
ncbi:MAG: hypothetical protein ACRDRT_12115, partial [Pseudonocardiaceae bacterium]